MAGRHDVVITGMGVVTPIGLSVGELLASLHGNRSGIGLWQSPLLGRDLPAGLIAHDFAGEFTRLELPYLDRCTQIALLAARQATTDAGLEQFADAGARAGLFYGSVCGGVTTEHDWVRQFSTEGKQVAKPYTLMASMLNAAPAQISIRHQILGPVMTHSSACTSSGSAIGDAARAIRHGYLDVALAGGAEASLTPTFMALWGGLRALAEPDAADVGTSCRPFSSKRNGLVLSEGAVFLLLESREHAERRGAGCYATLSGYGVASDGHHIGSPKLEGQVAALRCALADAGLGPEQIGYVNAHATGTVGGDPIEASAIREVLGDAPVSSTKAIHGHLLGAASALELAISILAIDQSFLPATAHLAEIDPGCALNHVANTPVFGHPIDHALSFSAGFGGTNAALIVSREEKLPRKTKACLQ
jgi:3-oxoacyl-[acyl-carrier-protein] synthase II